jgi:hypothetical protein
MDLQHPLLQPAMMTDEDALNAEDHAMQFPRLLDFYTQDVSVHGWPNSDRGLGRVFRFLLVRLETCAGSVPARWFNGVLEFRVPGREILFLCEIVRWAFIQTILSRLFRLSPLQPFWHRLAVSLLSSGRGCIPSPASL